MGDRAANERVVRRILEAVDDRDVAAVQASLHSSIVWRHMGNGGLSGDYEGVGAVLTLLAGLFERTDDTFRIEVHDITSSDRHVVVLARLTGERPGRTLDDRTVIVMEVADGAIIEGWSYSSDERASDQFWS